MGRILKILVGVVILAGLTAGGYAWVQSRGANDNGFVLIAVKRGAIVEKAVAVGQIEPRFKFDVKSKISGIVKRCAVEVGDRVKAGDPLFEIAPDPTPIELVDAESRLQSAESAFKRAKADWVRANELDQRGITSKESLDASREGFELAKVNLSSARDNLELIREGRIDSGGRKIESIIRAPSGGIVLQRLVDPGDPVVPLTSFQEGTKLATIADMNDLIFKGTVDEIDVGKLQDWESTARLKIGALPGRASSPEQLRPASLRRRSRRKGRACSRSRSSSTPAAGVTLRGGLLRQCRPGDPREGATSC